MRKLLVLACFAALAIMQPGCSNGAGPTDAAVSNRAAVDALNTWWKESNHTPTPVKVGTVTPAHTITSKTGRVFTVPKHVQTKKEAEDEARDARYMERRQALIQNFNAKGKTVTALTTLTRGSINILDPDPPSTSDAQTLCQSLGGFVWAAPNRHFGLENIEIIGAQGELLSSRHGIAGACVS